MPAEINGKQYLTVPEVTRLAQAAELHTLIGGQTFGLTVADVAEYWADYSRDFRSPWLAPSPASMAKFVGWLIDAMVRASR
jgi:hypothetical protein